jgi:hypothetical protein
VREANFRQRYNAAVVAVHRQGHRMTCKIGEIRLRSGDTLLLQTRPHFEQTYRNHPDFFLASGVAGNALTRLRGLGDPVTGQIQTSIKFLQKTDKSIEERIRQAQERVDRLIDNLEKQFLAADVVLARLEAQQRLLTSLFDAYNAQLRSNS